MRMLGVFEKSHRVRHIGHLDIQRAVQRGLRRSGLPVAYSNGFNPHILVAFASALSTGASGLREIMDVTLTEEISPDIFLAQMNQAMPPELHLVDARPVDNRHPALSALLTAAEYDITLREEKQASLLISSLPAMLSRAEIPALRKTKSGFRECDIRPLIYSLEAGDHTIRTTLALTEREACKPSMLLQALAGEAGIPSDQDIPVFIARTRLLGKSADGGLVPLESL